MIANIAAALTWVFVGPTLAQVELEQFIPETVLLSDLNVVGVFPEPITKVHCAARYQQSWCFKNKHMKFFLVLFRCTMMPDRACNIFYTTDDDCNLGKVDFIHQPPPIGSTVVSSYIQFSLVQQFQFLLLLVSGCQSFVRSYQIHSMSFRPTMWSRGRTLF